MTSQHKGFGILLRLSLLIVHCIIVVARILCDNHKLNQHIQFVIRNRSAKQRNQNLFIKIIELNVCCGVVSKIQSDYHKIATVKTIGRNVLAFRFLSPILQVNFPFVFLLNYSFTFGFHDDLGMSMCQSRVTGGECEPRRANEIVNFALDEFIDRRHRCAFAKKIHFGLFVVTDWEKKLISTARVYLHFSVRHTTRSCLHSMLNLDELARIDEYKHLFVLLTRSNNKQHWRPFDSFLSSSYY